MALSLRARLTAWYSVLLLLTLVLFSGGVFWLHWHLLLRQFDHSLDALTVTAGNVVESELEEHSTLVQAATEMDAVVHPPEFVVQVLDATFQPVRPSRIAVPLGSVPTSTAIDPGIQTVEGPGGRRWRVIVRPGPSDGPRYFIAAGVPFQEIFEHSRVLLDASLIGIPLALLLAGAGGWWLGRHGLRPLAAMAAEAQEITARTLEMRLTVPPVGQELEQLAGSFNHVLERLGSALSTQRRFMADASHELRTPVSIIRTAADVTLSQPVRDEEEYRDALSAVSQQSSRLTRLVDDMLVLARADGGGYPMRRAEVDQTALVEECVRDFAARAVAEGITVSTSLAPVELTGDDALLRRLFCNLLSNALTYTPRGGAVTVTLVRENGAAVLSVADTGPGIPVEERERVFERFVRLDPARGQGGAGLGLAIARWVAEAHGGHVRIASSGPGGSVFEARLPI